MRSYFLPCPILGMIASLNSNTEPRTDDLHDCIVQLKPSADRTFGGALFRVTKAETETVHGYFLTAHRGGRRAAWRRLKRCEFHVVGRAKYPEAEFTFRGGHHVID